VRLVASCCEVSRRTILWRGPLLRGGSLAFGVFHSDFASGSSWEVITMKYLGLSLVFVLLGTAVGFSGDEKSLNGAWIATEAKQDGEKLPDDFVKSASVTFTDGKYKSLVGDVTEEGTFKVDRSKKPNTIDMSPTGGRKKVPARPAIFELDGDTLKMCWNLTTNQRAKDFTSTAENKQFLVVYKRKK
jgi:uncharacterized protein (TIGR03067 family)